MKHVYTRFALPVLICAFAVSCYKDLSTEATMTLPEIEITSEYESLDVYYGETFTFTPEVRIKGRKQSDIEYKWDMTIKPLAETFDLELGTQKTLTYMVGNTPSNKPYALRLTVTDKVTGLVRSKSWDTYVLSPLGEGILVAHTADGGKTSDLSLLKAPSVTAEYSESPRITHNLFSLTNGKSIDGRVKSLCPVVSSNMKTYNLTRVFIGTDSELIALNYLDYKVDARNAELFQFAPDEKIDVDCLINYAGYAHGLVANGKYYYYICNMSYLYNPVTYFNTPSDIFSSKTLTAAKYSQGDVYLIDVNQGSFYYMPGWMVGGSFDEMSVSTTYQVKGATPLACGIMKDEKACFVSKADDGNVYATMITYATPAISSNYNLTEVVPDVEDAKGFAFCDNADFFYYYTDRQINALIVTGRSITHRSIAWTPDNQNEKITGLYQYHQGWYGTQGLSERDYPHVLDTHRLQMVITTYDQSTGEGKIYLRPFNVSTGLFTMQSNGTFGGFNEITAITTTLR
jgi:hypothetical protein